MSSKKRWGLGATVFVALALFWWARELASWRPQKIGIWPDALLVEDLAHGPWIVTSKQLINVENGHRISLPTSATKWSDYRFSSDGRSFALSVIEGDKFPYIEWRDSASGRLLRKFDKFLGDYAHQQGAAKLNFEFPSQGEKLIVIADNGVDFLSLNSPKRDFFAIPEWPNARPDPSLKVFSPDGKWLFVPETTDRPQLGSKIYNLSQRCLQSKIEMSLNTIHQIGFSPDGTSVIITNYTSNDDGSRKSEIWMADVQTGRKLWDFAPFHDNMEDSIRRNFPFRFSPDGQRLIALNPSHDWELRSARSGKLIRRLPPIFGQSTFAPDGNFLYTLDEDSILWKIRVR